MGNMFIGEHEIVECHLGEKALDSSLIGELLTGCSGGVKPAVGSNPNIHSAAITNISQNIQIEIEFDSSLQLDVNNPDDQPFQMYNTTGSMVPNIFDMVQKTGLTYVLKTFVNVPSFRMKQEARFLSGIQRVKIVNGHSITSCFEMFKGITSPYTFKWGDNTLGPWNSDSNANSHSANTHITTMAQANNVGNFAKMFLNSTGIRSIDLEGTYPIIVNQIAANPNNANTGFESFVEGCTNLTKINNFAWTGVVSVGSFHSKGAINGCKRFNRMFANTPNLKCIGYLAIDPSSQGLAASTTDMWLNTGLNIPHQVTNIYRNPGNRCP